MADGRPVAIRREESKTVDHCPRAGLRNNDDDESARRRPNITRCMARSAEAPWRALRLCLASLSRLINRQIQTLLRTDPMVRGARRERGTHRMKSSCARGIDEISRCRIEAYRCHVATGLRALAPAWRLWAGLARQTEYPLSTF